jgi:hypothetical protein
MAAAGMTLLCGAALLAVAHASRADAAEAPAVVSPAALREAMSAIKGYDPTATTNGARFQAEVLVALARQARSRDPGGPPLFIGHADWFAAFLAATGRTADRAPLFARLAHQHGQDITVEHRPERVFRGGGAGPAPALAANVQIAWAAGPGAPASYSYEDALSTPRLKVTNKRVIRYRLIDFGDMLLFDEVTGLTGRPQSGMLGLLFQLIGEGHVVEYRMAIAPDGLQISYGRAKKAFIGVDSTVTVYPDGRSEKGLPEGRADLRALEARLKRPLKIEYQPFR